MELLSSFDGTIQSVIMNLDIARWLSESQYAKTHRVKYWIELEDGTIQVELIGKRWLELESVTAFLSPEIVIADNDRYITYEREFQLKRTQSA